MKGFRERLCESSIFIAIIAYVLIGYFADTWTWPLLVFLIVPLLPFILRLKKFPFSFELIVLIIYLFIGLTFNLWHPYWVIFLLIPIYHIMFDKTQIKKYFKEKKLRKKFYNFKHNDSD